MNNFARIDFTKDECEAIALLAEMYVDMQRAFPIRFARREFQQIAAAMNGVKMKCSVAASIIKPDVITALPPRDRLR